jgi:DNA-binding Lrp family transcriptional regulator
VNKSQSAAGSLREASSRVRVVFRGACSLSGSGGSLRPFIVIISTDILQLVQRTSFALVNLTNAGRLNRQEVVILQELDATDRRILVALDEDPRVPVMMLAQKLGLARGTVQSVSAELDQSHLNEAIAALRNIPEVLECHAPAGDTDLLIRVVARSPDDLYRVSEEIRLCPGIVRTSTSMFLREVISYRTTGLLGG